MLLDALIQDFAVYAKTITKHSVMLSSLSRKEKSYVPAEETIA